MPRSKEVEQDDDDGFGDYDGGADENINDAQEDGELKRDIDEEVKEEKDEKEEVDESKEEKDELEEEKDDFEEYVDKDDAGEDEEDAEKNDGEEDDVKLAEEPNEVVAVFDDNCIDQHDDLGIELNQEDKEIVSKKEDRITRPYLTKYERVKLICVRAKQIQLGAKPLIKNIDGLLPERIAEEEIKHKICPFFIIRKRPDGVKEVWHTKELKLDLLY
jgi:DNA-directed RNA polymerase I, II, and III subunit RPABC2